MTANVSMGEKWIDNFLITFYYYPMNKIVDENETEQI